MLFPIDHGNSAMKTVNFVFPSGLIDNPIRPPVDTEMLEYDGKFWTLSGQRISYMRDKTKDERYWILTLFAIAKELEKKEIGFEYLHGGVPSEKRKNLVDNFMNEPSSRVFLSTDAGSTGLNLQSAATIINIDLPWNPAVLEQRIGRIYRLGQQNNIQVINLVTPDSIEQEMLGKLRFKTSMFEGVLDDGEDSVFITDDKFSKMMETVSGMVEEDEETEKARNKHKSNENKEEVSIQQQTNSSSNGESVSNRSSQPKDLVAQGISFLSGLAETLKSPEATAQLVDSIVEKNEQTGETSIKIPVESKETVSNLLNLIGKLFAK